MLCSCNRTFYSRRCMALLSCAHARKFREASQRSPSRISFCTCSSHSSSVRTNSVSSVATCTEPSPLPQRIACPCAMSGFGSNCRPQHKYSPGMLPRTPPLGGSSCQKSPTKATLIPPNARSAPPAPFFMVPTSLITARSFISSSASNFAPTILTSNMNNHRHCIMRAAISVCFRGAFRADLGSLLPPKGFLPGPSTNNLHRTRVHAHTGQKRTPGLEQTTTSTPQFDIVHIRICKLPHKLNTNHTADSRTLSTTSHPQANTKQLKQVDAQIVFHAYRLPLKAKH